MEYALIKQCKKICKVCKPEIADIIVLLQVLIEEWKFVSFITIKN